MPGRRPFIRSSGDGRVRNLRRSTSWHCSSPGPGGPAGSSGSDVWLYNTLIVVAALIATARPVLVARDRLA